MQQSVWPKQLFYFDVIFLLKTMYDEFLLENLSISSGYPSPIEPWNW
jgi:hypothetical protein